jgi:hypothetical protein
MFRKLKGVLDFHELLLTSQLGPRAILDTFDSTIHNQGNGFAVPVLPLVDAFHGDHKCTSAMTQASVSQPRRNCQCYSSRTLKQFNPKSPFKPKGGRNTTVNPAGFVSPVRTPDVNLPRHNKIFEYLRDRSAGQHNPKNATHCHKHNAFGACRGKPAAQCQKIHACALCGETSHTIFTADEKSPNTPCKSVALLQHFTFPDKI